MTIELRVGVEADADVIARLHAESWRVAYRGIYRDEFLDGPVFEERRAEWARRFASAEDNRHLLLAMDGDEPAGFMCAYGEADERWGTVVDNLHVLPNYQRRSLGRRLLAEAARWSMQKHAGAPMHLWVLDGNAKARRFYEHLGAHAEELVESEPPGGGVVQGWRYVWTSAGALLERTSVR